MAINETNDNGGAGAAPSPAAQPPIYNPTAASSPAAPSMDDQPLRFGNLGLGGQQLINNPPMEKSLGSEALTRLQLSMDEIIKRKVSEQYTYKLISVESGKGGLYYSTLVLALQVKNRLQGAVSYYSMILEASADAPPPLFVNNPAGKQIEVMRPASDAYDMKFRTVINEVVMGVYGGVEGFTASATIVPRDFNIDDAARVQKLAVNAMLACHQELALREPGFRDVQLGAASQDSTLRVSHRFDDTRTEDAVGNPNRSDVSVVFVSQRTKQANNQPQSLNSGDRQEEVSAARGFIDLVYDPLLPQGQGAWMQQPNVAQNPDILKRYVARFVCTSMDFSRLYTIPTTLAAIATTVTLRDSNNWYTAFYQRGATADKKEIDLRDIGALGYEVNIAPGRQPDNTRYDTKSNNWQPSDLGSLLGMTTRQGLMFSFDVPDCGPETWHEDFLSEASNGSSGARQAILKAANILTNNEFGQVWQGTPEEIFADEGQRIHLGYCLDKDNRKQDIRVYDYVAVLNLTGAKDPSIITQWSDTFNNTNVPLNERLETRKKLLLNMNNTCVFTGFATRVTLSHKFLDALVLSCVKAGLRLTLNTPMASAEYMNTRGTGVGTSAALMPVGPTGFVQQAGYAPTNQAGFGQNGGRWGR